MFLIIDNADKSVAKTLIWLVSELVQSSWTQFSQEIIRGLNKIQLQNGQSNSVYNSGFFLIQLKCNLEDWINQYNEIK